MEINNIQDYFKIAKAAETVHRFHILLKRMAYQPEEFTRDNAHELLDIIDNEKENLLDMAKTFQKMGEKVELIPDENWEGLRKQVLMYL